MEIVERILQVADSPERIRLFDELSRNFSGTVDELCALVEAALQPLLLWAHSALSWDSRVTQAK